MGYQHRRRTANYLPVVALVVASLAPGCSFVKRNERASIPSVGVGTLPTLTLAAVGDIMLGSDYPANTLPDDDGVGFLADAAPILSEADIAFGNLEGVLRDGGNPVKVCADRSQCYLFRTPARYAGH